MNDDPMQRLIKLVEMTRSSNDNEALVAMRKANALIQQQDWNWAALFAERQALFDQGIRQGFAMAHQQMMARAHVPAFHVVFG